MRDTKKPIDSNSKQAYISAAEATHKMWEIQNQFGLTDNELTPEEEEELEYADYRNNRTHGGTI